MKSEFYEVDSLDAFDYRPVDLSGALEVVIVVDGDSFITNEPNPASSDRPATHRSFDRRPTVLRLERRQRKESPNLGNPKEVKP